MVYELVKYEQTERGLLLPNRPKEITKLRGEILGAYFNPIFLRSLFRPRTSRDHFGLKLKFKNREDWDREFSLLIQETSDLGHLIEIAHLGRDSDCWELVGKEVSLYLGKGNEGKCNLYGFSFDFC